jgi:hypothetical protein
MNYDEFQRQLGKAGVKACEFADLIGMNRNSVTNYSKEGKVPSHLAALATLMGEMAERKVDFRGPLSRIDIERKKPRGAGAKGHFGGDKQEDMFIAGKRSKPRQKAGEPE